MNNSIENRIEIGLRKLGYPGLRGFQEEAIYPIMEGKSCIISAPTGSGKSALYLLPALTGSYADLTLVIVPLKALAYDRVRNLRKRLEGALSRCCLAPKGIELLNSDMTTAERQDVLERVRNRQVTIVYLSPEQFNNAQTREALFQARVVRVVIDECHVLMPYSEGFRPAYGCIGQFISHLPEPQILLFSATLTQESKDFLLTSLNIKNCEIFTFTKKRKNLERIWQKIDAKGNELEQLRYQSVTYYLDTANRKDLDGCSIVYCVSVKQTIKTYERLKADGYACTCYYGELSGEQRKKNMKKFVKKKCPIMVATTAFGLGIDIPDVRLILNVGVPLTLDDYVQQTGRAGRDGKKSRCIMIYGDSDWAKVKKILNKKRWKEAGDFKKMVDKGVYDADYVEKYFS